MTVLKMMTCLGENTVPICSELAQALAEKVGVEIVFDPVAESTPAAQKLVRGEVQIGWICGLLYTMLLDEQKAPIELLGAPIFTDSDQPEYYSHLVVPVGSPAESLADLQGKSLAINETTSWSGYHLLRANLHEMGLAMSYFGEVVESGGHSKSMVMIAEGLADSATIDHGVFDFVSDDQPELLKKIRVIGKIGPSPSPPFVINGNVPQDLKDRIKRALLELGQDEPFLQKVRPHRLASIVPIEDEYYEPIRVGFQNSKKMG